MHFDVDFVMDFIELAIYDFCWLTTRVVRKLRLVV